MPNPRPLALIGLASVVAAIASPSEAVRPLQHPVVQSIVVRPETVWFCALQPDSQRLAYAFSRSTRTWGIDAAARVCGSTRPRLHWFDSVPMRVRAGVRIEVMAQRDGQGLGQRRAYLRYTDSARRLTIDLRPSLTASRAAALAASHGNIDDDTTAITVGAATANDSLTWIGLGGGFPEGAGSLGGIYRIDRRTGRWRWIVDSALSWNAVTGIAQTRHWLWVGTEQPAEQGAFGRYGLLRMNPASGVWRNYTPENSPLPDARIMDVEADEKIVAIATENGLAVAELAKGRAGIITRWSVRYFVPTYSGDSVTYGLAARVGKR